MPDRDPALEAAIQQYTDFTVKLPPVHGDAVRFGWDAALRSLGAGTPEAQQALRELVRAVMEERRTLKDGACTAAQWVAATDVAYSAGKSFAALATPTEWGTMSHRTRTVTEERWAMWSPDGQCLIADNGDTLLWHSQADAEADRLGDHFPICVRVTLTYEAPNDD